MTRQGSRRIILRVAVVFSALVLPDLLAPRPAAADLVRTMLNWDIGQTALIPKGAKLDLTYKDAHVTITTKGTFPLLEPIVVIVGGFDSGKATPSGPITGNDKITVDWKSAAGVTGKTHIGVAFTEDVAGSKSEYKFEAKLTDITAAGNVSLASDPLPLPTVHSGRLGPSPSLIIEPPTSLIPTKIEDLLLYKIPTQPLLLDLDFEHFPTIPKTPQPTLPNPPVFPTPLGAMEFELPGLLVGEWLLGSFRLTWTDEALTAAMGEPVEGSVDTWFAMQIVPEPSTWILMAGGAVLLGVARCRSVRTHP